MKRIQLRGGGMIPAIGLGTWEMKGEVCLRAIPMALEMGYRHIDTAFAYYNEQFVGKAIQGFSREQLFITTKLWREFHDPKRVEEACDRSLKDLGSGYIDLYLMHWPERKNMVDVFGAMVRLKEKGKVRSIGICNATVGHLEVLLKKNIPIAVNQVEFHPFLNQKELLSFFKSKEIVVTAYCPLARGKVFKEKMLIAIGKKHGKTAGQVTLSWLLQKGLVVIPKGSSKEHLKENLEALDFALSKDEMAEIDRLHRGERMVSPEFNEFAM